ncbi:transmembrane glycosyltransferase [gut metagenome]|uniref:Transmembrane glycosyltransferase n=1 Tax=gut metagenome TaxID=749906 RepID=J9H2N4_9ZZZZ
MEIFVFDTTEKILLITTGLLLLIQLFYYSGLYSRIARRNHAIGNKELHFGQEQPPLSVILYAHEAAEQLRKNLPAILKQEYPQFEVIVIIDGQDDGSEDYLTMMEERYPHLYHSFIPNSSRYISRKKLAITLGIKASKYDWIVLTETNCQPQSQRWLQTLARNFTSHTEIVLGYSSYERGHSWLHKQIAYDNLFTGMRYLGAALGGHPYMGFGKNLAYRKELFYQHKGLSAHLNLQRGDDDLFVNQVALADNTRVECAPEALVRMSQPQRAKDWYEEKISYRSTAHLYKGCQRWLFGFETTTRLLFHGYWITTCGIGLWHFHWTVAGIALLAFLLRWCLQGFVLHSTTQALQEERNYFWTLPIFDLLQPIQSLRWELNCLFRKKSDFLRK